MPLLEPSCAPEAARAHKSWPGTCSGAAAPSRSDEEGEFIDSLYWLQSLLAVCQRETMRILRMGLEPLVQLSHVLRHMQRATGLQLLGRMRTIGHAHTGTACIARHF